MNIRHTIILALIVLCLPLVSQNYIIEGDYINEEFIETNFEGGYAGYSDYFEANLVFPQSSYKAQTEGLLLSKITFNPVEQNIEIQFLSILDKSIEEQVSSLMSDFLKKWTVKENKEFTLYQPIVYSLLPYYAETLEGEIPEIPVDLPLKFMKPFILIKAKRIPDDITLEALKNNEATEKQKTFYTRAQEAYTKFIDADNLEDAHAVLTRIIRYNPLDRDYLLERIRIEKEMGKRQFQSYDALLLADFVDEANNEYKRINGKRPNQSPSMEINDKIHNAMRQKYEGGKYNFNKAFTKSIIYPANSINDKTEGMLLVKLKIDQNSSLDIEFLTFLDQEIEDNIRKSLESTINSWLESGETSKFYLALNYSLGAPYFGYIATNNDEIPVSFPYPFIDRYDVVDYSKFSSLGISIFDNQERRLAEIFNNRYDRMKLSYQKYLSKGKKEKAYKTLNNIIKLNPFNKAFIEQRAQLALELDDNTYQAYDDKWLNSIEELIDQINH